jgi:hypothetical protein
MDGVDLCVVSRAVLRAGLLVEQVAEAKAF